MKESRAAGTPRKQHRITAASTDARLGWIERRRRRTSELPTGGLKERHQWDDAGGDAGGDAVGHSGVDSSPQRRSFNGKSTFLAMRETEKERERERERARAREKETIS